MDIRPLNICLDPNSYSLLNSQPRNREVRAVLRGNLPRFYVLDSEGNPKVSRTLLRYKVDSQGKLEIGKARSLSYSEQKGAQEAVNDYFSSLRSMHTPFSLFSNSSGRAALCEELIVFPRGIVSGMKENSPQEEQATGNTDLQADHNSTQVLASEETSRDHTELGEAFDQGEEAQKGRTYLLQKKIETLAYIAVSPNLTAFGIWGLMLAGIDVSTTLLAAEGIGTAEGKTPGIAHFNPRVRLGALRLLGADAKTITVKHSLGLIKQEDLEKNLAVLILILTAIEKPCHGVNDSDEFVKEYAMMIQRNILSTIKALSKQLMPESN